LKPAALNDGWTYRDKVPLADAGTLVSDWLADRYRHSDGLVWQQRIAAGELDWNGALLTGDRALQGGETLCWRRPPWLEEAIPDQWETIHDDGDCVGDQQAFGLAGDAWWWFPAPHAHGLA
jgi:23S rRNA pseudouridine1911/1915/1917 synthase